MKTFRLFLGVTTLLLFSHWSEARQPLSPEVEARISSYKEKLHHKSLSELTAETGINLGVTASQCGPDVAERIVKSVKKSTDSDELRDNWEHTQPKSLCREASVKLGVSSEALKKRSHDAFKAFLKVAEGK
jgi:hypothetical protein